MAGNGTQTSCVIDSGPAGCSLCSQSLFSEDICESKVSCGRDLQQDGVRRIGRQAKMMHFFPRANPRAGRIQV